MQNGVSSLTAMHLSMIPIKRAFTQGDPVRAACCPLWFPRRPKAGWSGQTGEYGTHYLSERVCDRFRYGRAARSGGRALHSQDPGQRADERHEHRSGSGNGRHDIGRIAAFGVTFVSDLIVREQFWLRIGGGTLLFALGIRLFLVQQKDPVVPFLEKTWFGSYVSVILLGLTNPMTVFSFFAVFATFGLAQSMTVLNGSLVVSGIFAGSSLWFFTLSYLATSFRGRLESGGFQWVNRFAAFLVIACGVAAFVSVL